MRFKSYIIIFGICALTIAGIFFSGKWIKNRWIVHATLNSRHWMEREKEINSIPQKKYEVIMLGNSLTELFYLDQYFGRTDMLNCGIVGDFSEGLLKRIDGICNQCPGKLFIEIGINDIVEGISLKEICSNYTSVIRKIKSCSPRTRIFIQSNLPLIVRHPSLLVSDQDINERVKKQNENLREIAVSEGVTFIDIYTQMVNSGPLEELVVEDGIHLTDKAYRIWAATITPYLESSR